MKVKLKKLVIQNFRTFVGTHELEFPDHGLVILRGENKDTKGDSGAGKTNVLLAISYALDFCRLPVKSLQSWHTDDSMSVGLYLDVGESEAQIYRSAKNCYILVNGDKITGAKAVNAKIDQLLGLPADLRELLTYRDQVEPNRILDMKDSELKEFLTAILQLGNLEKQVKESVKRVSESKKEAEAAIAVLQPYKDEVDRLAKDLQEPVYQSEAEEVAKLSRIEASILAEVINLSNFKSLNEQIIEKGRNAVAKYKEDIDNEPIVMEPLPSTAKLMQAKEFLKQLIEQDEVKRSEFLKEKQVLASKVRDLHEIASQKNVYSIKIGENNILIDSLRENTCPTCNQSFTSDELIAKTLQENIELVTKFEESSAAESKRNEIAAELESLTFEGNPQIGRLTEIKTKLETEYDFKAAQIQKDFQDKLNRKAEIESLEIRKILDQFSFEIKQVEDKINQTEKLILELKGQKETINQDIRFIKYGNENAKKHYETRLKAIEESKKRLILAENKADEAKSKLNQELDYQILIQGFRAKIFDETLQSIGVIASEILGNLSNAQHLSIEFQSERQTGAGTIDQSIKPVIYVNGEARSMKETVSGGQLTSLHLATDLAVSRVISQRLGVVLGWLCLDEAFEGHDSVTKFNCLEMLQAEANDKMIIIVDHNSEYKEMFAKEIRVVMNNGQSRIQ